nr:RHS repeat-associated core domain-containing protein [Streptomyces chartreusis]
MVEYTLNDPQGTTHTLTNSTGTNPQRQYFDPYGLRVTAGGTVPALTAPSGLTRGYTGHEMDDDTGLINMKGRLYDPSTKRFTTPDPRTKPENPLNWDPYAYVNNNPPTQPTPPDTRPMTAATASPTLST